MKYLFAVSTVLGMVTLCLCSYNIGQLSRDADMSVVRGQRDEAMVIAKEANQNEIKCVALLKANRGWK